MYSAIDLLERERIKRGYTRERLTRGICSQQLLAKAKNNGTEMSLLAFEILVERLGRSPELLEFIISNNEYDSMVLRDSIDEKASEGNITAVDELLSKYIPDLVKASQCERMYYYRTRAYALVNSNSSDNLNEAMDNIISAIQSTLPGISRDNYREYLFSTYEFENLLIYARILIQLGKVEKAVQLIEKVIQYVNFNYVDDWLRVRIIPKCMYLISMFGDEYVSLYQRTSYCEEAIELIRNTGTIYMLKPLLDKLIQYYTVSCRELDVDLWIQIRNLIEDVWNEFFPDFIHESLIFRWKKAAYHLESEVVHAERVKSGLSQEELANGVFSNVASISYIENGHYSLSKEKYAEITEKLKMEKPRRGGFVLVDSFDSLAQIESVRNACTRQDYERVLKLVTDILTKNGEINEVIESYKVSALSYLNKISMSEMLEMLRNEIDKTYPLDRIEYYRKPFQGEMDMIVSYTWKLHKNMSEDAKTIIKRIMDICDRTAIDAKYFYRIRIAVSENYLNYCGEELSYDEIDRVSNSTIRNSLLSGNGAAISDAYLIRYKALHESEILKRSYYFSELYKEKTASIMKQRFRDYLN